MQHYTDVLIDTAGNVRASVAVTVYRSDGSTLATIYSDDGSTTKSNPTTTDSNGVFNFYAANGKYVLSPAGGSTRDILLFDPTERTTADAATNLDDLTVTTHLRAPVAAPASPVTGDLFEVSGVLKHGSASKVVADLATAQAWTAAQDFSATELKIPTAAPGTPAAGHLWLASDVLKHGASSVVVMDLSTNQTVSGDNSYTGTQTFKANKWVLTDGSDATKKLNLVASGITTATTRSLTVPDANGTIALTTAPGSSGADVAWSAAGQLLIPDAGASARGVVTTSTQTLAGAKTFSGALVASSTLAVTGATTLSSTLSYRQLTEDVTTTNVITAAESGSTFFLDSATEFVSTLPAPAAGLHFKFIVKAAPSGASYTIVTNASANIIVGQVMTSQDAGGSADSETTGGDTISFVDSKAVIGDWVEVVSDGTNWYMTGASKVFDAITITTVS